MNTPPLLLIVLLLSVFSWYHSHGQADSIKILYATSDPAMAFVPEVEDILENLVFDSLNLTPYVYNLRRLPDSEDLQQTIYDNVNTYLEQDPSDPERNVIFDLVQNLFKHSDYFVEIRLNNKPEKLFLFEFLRYKNIGKDSPKLAYTNSSTAIIDLSSIDRAKIKEELETAIYKIFPEANRRPKAVIVANAKEYGDAIYYYGRGDSIILTAVGIDNDSPKEDFRYYWKQEKGLEIEEVPLAARAHRQSFTSDVEGQISISLAISDGIRRSDTTQATINILRPPQILDLYGHRELRRTIKSYYWNTGGDPIYYYKEVPNLILKIYTDPRWYNPSETRLKLCLNDTSPSAITAAAIPMFKKGERPLQQTDFQLEYEDLSRDTVIGKLKLPLTSVAPRNYRFNVGLSHFGVSSPNDMQFVLDMRKISRLSYEIDARFSSFTETARQGEPMMVYTGIRYKIRENNNLNLMPGAIFQKGFSWQFSGRLGIEYEEPIRENFDRLIGGDFGGVFYEEIFTEDPAVKLTGIYSVNLSVFIKTQVFSPHNQLKFSVFHEAFFNDDLEDLWGFGIGYSLSTIGR